MGLSRFKKQLTHPYTADIIGYQNAVWDFMLEHYSKLKMSIKKQVKKLENKSKQLAKKGAKLTKEFIEKVKDPRTGKKFKESDRIAMLTINNFSKLTDKQAEILKSWLQLMIKQIKSRKDFGGLKNFFRLYK